MKIAGFYEESMSNGIGWRSVLFVSGCPHHCEGCHNPETWSKDYGQDFDKEYYLNKIKQSDIVSGVTLSGGEPFLYAKELLPFVDDVISLGLNIWAYTGYRYEDLLAMQDPFIDSLLGKVDVLIDGRFELSEKQYDLRFIGSANQRIIDLKGIRSGNSIEDSLLH